jgi:hypothetical protein
MFGARYFGARSFGRRYWGKTGLTVEGQYFGGRFFGGWYWGQRYWGPDTTIVLGTHFGGRYWGVRNFGRHYFGTKGAPGFVVTRTAGASLAGSLNFGSTAFTFTSSKVIAPTTLGLAATLGISAQLSFDNDTDFCVTPPIDLPGLTGNLLVSGDFTVTTGEVVPGSFWGRRYWGGRFYGPKYWGRGAGFVVAAPAGLSLAGSMTTAGDFATTVIISPTSLLALSGSLGFDPATLVIVTAAPPPPPPDDEWPGGGKPPRKPPHRDDFNEDGRTNAENEMLINLVCAVVASGALD